MCVPATSAAVDRTFSRSDLLIRSHRSRFSEANICIVTSLRCNKTLILMLVNNFACKQL
jgi:hypothetical protein